MSDFNFKALGTQWSLRIDGGEIAVNHKEEIFDRISTFEERFSRFLPHSEVNAFREAAPGTYTISKEFATLLTEADRLRTLTNGAYDPAAGALLEGAGYDATYSLTPSKDIEHFSLPHWSLVGETLTLEGPTAFDLGGMGKGYCIDMVASILSKQGYKHILVDGGGDMYGTTKKDGSGWQIAIQYPGKTDTAAGTVELRNQGLAVSDTFRRRWGKWHHIVDPKRKVPIDHIVGAVAVTPSAWHADCMTSVLFLAPPDKRKEASQIYNASYFLFQKNGTCVRSKNWEGKLFV